MARLRGRHEDFPDAGIAQAHGMALRVPVVEIANDGNEFGIGSPDGEANSIDRIECCGVRTEGFPGFVKRAFGVQMEIEIRDHVAKTVGVVEHGLAAVEIVDVEPVGAWLALQFGDEEAFAMALLHRHRGALDDDTCRFGLRQEGADLPRGLSFFDVDGMGPEDAEGVAVISPNDCFHFGGIHGNFDYMALTELHLHLEGTVDRDTVMMLDPSLTREEVDRMWRFTDFEGFLGCFKFIVQRLRGPEDYALITRRMIESLASHGVDYAEVTLAVGVVLWREFDFAEVWRAIRAAQKEACARTGIEIWWNLDAIRQFGPEHVMRVARVAAEYVGDGAISFGIGGDEIRGPARDFRDAYKYAKDAGLRLTAHAGETGGADSIWGALEIGAERIGHGIRAVDDPELMRRLRDERIPLEISITSNVLTGAVWSLEEHPVRRLFEAGVPITLNTDDPGVFDTDLTQEFEIARKVFGFSEAELAQTLAWAEEFRFGGKPE